MKEELIKRFTQSWKKLANELDDPDCVGSEILLAVGIQNNRKFQVTIRILIDDDFEFLDEGYGEINLNKKLKKKKKKKKTL